MHRLKVAHQWVFEIHGQQVGHSLFKPAVVRARKENFIDCHYVLYNRIELKVEVGRLRSLSSLGQLSSLECRFIWLEHLIPTSWQGRQFKFSGRQKTYLIGLHVSSGYRAIIKNGHYHLSYFIPFSRFIEAISMWCLQSLP